MAGPDENGCFPNDTAEYAFVLNNGVLWEAVYNQFGYAPVREFGSYSQVNPEMRTQILSWLRRQDLYWDQVLGLNEATDVVDAVPQPNVVEHPNVVDQPINLVDTPENVVDDQHIEVQDPCSGVQADLEQRISKLEIIFQYLKERKEEKERKERNEGRGKDESREESSGSNRLG